MHEYVQVAWRDRVLGTHTLPSDRFLTGQPRSPTSGDATDSVDCSTSISRSREVRRVLGTHRLGVRRPAPRATTAPPARRHGPAARPAHPRCCGSRRVARRGGSAVVSAVVPPGCDPGRRRSLRPATVTQRTDTNADGSASRRWGHTKAEIPVRARPTMSELISRVPSKL